MNTPITPQAGFARGMKPSRFRLKKILVPVDFSESSRKALQYALPFAEEFGGSVHLVHVVEPILYPAEMNYVTGDMATLDETAEDRARTALAELAEREIPEENRGEAQVRIGLPHEEVAAAARELDVDLVILSTHGYTGLKHALLGSTAEKMIRHSPCPVLTVREREHDFV